MKPLKFIFFGLSLLVQLNLLAQTNTVVNTVQLNGNERTKAFFIIRELNFKVGDTLSIVELQQRLIQSKRNLMNTHLFNFVSAKDTLINGKTTIIINVVERWYLWPIPLFELQETNFNTWWKKKNFNRTNYGFYVIKNNVMGKGEILKFVARFGFSQQSSLEYFIPYVNQSKTLGIKIKGGYNQNHEINITTINNKRIFYKNDIPVRKNYYFRNTWIYRPALYTKFQLKAAFTHLTISDSLLANSSDYIKVGQNLQQTSLFSVSVSVSHDRRDFIIYPLKGYFLSAQLDKKGLGLLHKNGVDVLFAQIKVEHYFKIVNRFYFGSSIKTKYSLGNPSGYFFQRSLGYHDNLRGYGYYVIDGQSLGLFKSNFKYQLIQRKTKELNILKTKKFDKIYYAMYANVFFDAGYVKDSQYTQNNFLANHWQYSTGIGVDFVTYYDQILRIDFALNKLGDTGFFINFTQPI